MLIPQIMGPICPHRTTERSHMGVSPSSTVTHTEQQATTIINGHTHRVTSYDAGGGRCKRPEWDAGAVSESAGWRYDIREVRASWWAREQ